MKTIKKILSKFLTEFAYVYALLFVQPFGNKVLRSFDYTENVLYIVPHADDELLSGYSFLESLRGNAKILYCGYTGSINDKNNSNVRKEEISNFCRKNKYALIAPDDWRDEFISIIEKNKISTVFLPSPVDWHEEHRKISLELVKLFPDGCHLKFFWYSVTVPIMSDYCEFVGMTHMQQKEKYRCFDAFYYSQRHMPLMRFKVQERISGKAISCFAAESFLPIEFDQMRRIVFALNNNTMLNSLKEKINSPYKIRKYSRTMYKHIGL